MSWFGRGSSQKEEEPAEKGFVDDAGFGGDLGSAVPSSSAGMSDFTQFSVALQQQVLVQQVITELSHKAFVMCATQSKDSKLSGREVACIHAATNKWLDCNEFMLGRLAKKQQQQAATNQFS